jgi:hypothetical protein
MLPLTDFDNTGVVRRKSQRPSAGFFGDQHGKIPGDKARQHLEQLAGTNFAEDYK